jgi:hypothetical protein
MGYSHESFIYCPLFGIFLFTRYLRFHVEFSNIRRSAVISVLSPYIFNSVYTYIKFS